MRATLAPSRLIDLTDRDFLPLVAESEAEGFRFVRRVHDEWRNAASRFDAPGEALLGVFDGGALVGICGLSRDPYAKDPRIGRLRNLYVVRARRGQGLGAALAREVIRLASSSFEVLRLRAATPESASLYEALGFTLVTDEPDATHVMRFGVRPARASASAT
ncbi:MAG TPA: GNAT family N-acetyltransferase [Thermoanaerobaculia bacterium]|nr:GNAT family N-acetyltransferase [Thermoanaerobaculia bacterium]